MSIRLVSSTVSVLPEPGQRIRLVHCGIVSAQLPNACLQAGKCFFAALNENRRACAARQGFETESASAGKKIKAFRALYDGRKPVEQCFANSLRGWPKAWLVCDRQKATAPFSGYNTQPS